MDRLANLVRAKIISGELAPGSRLPSTLELARQWSSYVPAVQGALAKLAKEGLLDRRPCLGTFVRARGLELNRVGILAAARMWDDQAGFYFQRQIFLMVNEILASRGVHTTVWFEHRRDEKAARPLPAVARAVRQHEVQALLALNADAHSAAWLSALPIPVTGLVDLLPTHVYLNPMSFFEVALDQLKKLGCRTVGLISPVPAAEVDYYQGYRDAARRVGLETREEWIRADKPYRESMEHFGYEQFRALWSLPERPRGLLVYPDVTARGVLLAVSTLGARVPADLELVFHRNVGIPFECPLPVTFVESSCRDCSVALIEQLDQLHRAQTCPVRTVNYCLASEPEAGLTAPRKRPAKSRRAGRK